MRVVKKVQPPTGLRRILFRLPVHLYRAGLGGVFGRRFLYLVHTGRVSGRKRDVVVEVVGRAGDRYHVCSGFGPRAQWYRNVLANPEVTIQVGWRRTRADALAVSPEKGADIMARYAAQHPKLARQLCAVMGLAVNGSAADFMAVGRHVPFVEFVPR